MRTLALVLLCGCGASLSNGPNETRPARNDAPTRVASDRPASEEPIAHDTPEPTFVVHVRLHEGHATLTARGRGVTWRAPEGPLDARDDDGPLELTREGDAVRFDRAPRGDVVLTREVTLASSRCAYLPPLATPFPDDDTPQATRWVVEAEGDVATTLGPGEVHERVALPSELATTAVLAGALDRVAFETRLGRDTLHACTVGADARWMAAELALMRTRIDTWLGGLDAEPFHVLAHDAESLSVARSGAGLVVELEGAWNAEARLASAHVLVRRWIGGLLRFEGDDRWATLGLARWVALTRLSEMGLLSPEELATELTRHEAALVLYDATEDEELVLHARSTLFAFDLAARRGNGDGSLRALLLAWLAAAEDLRGRVPRERLLADLGDEAPLFAAWIEGRESTRALAAGPCMRREAGVHRRFAWGFDVPRARDPLGEVVVRGLVAGSRAARAGLNEGDVLHDLRGDSSHPEHPITARRGELTLRWRAFDREARGGRWRVVAGADPSRCAEPR
ncbi:MAG: hypothetical protein H6721_09190 [Sandaracinus sp.]|nr:hypothetical protein [Sandaracinus sp.]